MNAVANLPHGLVTDGAELRAAIEKAWNERTKTQGLKPGTATYRRAEVEFFTGAMTTLNAVFPHADGNRLSPVVPVLWVINAMSGRPITESPRLRRSDNNPERRAEDGYVGA